MSEYTKHLDSLEDELLRMICERIGQFEVETGVPVQSVWLEFVDVQQIGERRPRKILSRVMVNEP